MRLRKITAITALIVLLPIQAAASPVPDREIWRTYTLSLINENRKREHLPLLGLDDALNALSQRHAADSALHFDDTSTETRHSSYLVHVGSDGRTLLERIRDRGIMGGDRFGENVGFLRRDPFTDFQASIQLAIAFLHDKMMAEVPPEDGHRKNILGDFTHVGVGLELHREAGSAVNVLFLVTDFGHFTDHRPVEIPEVGTLPTTVTPPPKPEKKPKIQATAPVRRRRAPVRSRRLPPLAKTVQRRTRGH